MGIRLQIPIRKRTKVFKGPLWWDCLANRRGSFGGREPPSVIEGARPRQFSRGHLCRLELGPWILLPLGPDRTAHLDSLGNSLSKPAHRMAEWLEGEVGCRAGGMSQFAPHCSDLARPEVRDPDLGPSLPSDPVSPFLTRLNWTELGTKKGRRDKCLPSGRDF